MKIKNRRIIGVGALLLGVALIVAAALLWFVGRDFNTLVQAALALGAVGLAAAAALEIDLLTQTLRSRQARFGAEAVGVSLAFIAVIALLNFIFNQDRLKQRWDLTETGENSLAPETLDVLADLPAGVRFVGFYQPASPARTRAEEMLENYVFFSDGRLEYEFIDPVVQLGAAQEYGADDNSLFVELDDRREEVDFVNEQSITAALIRVVHPTERVLYFVTGRQERDREEFGDTGLSQVASDLERVGYTLETTSLFGEALPEGIDVLVLAGALTPYSQEEVDKVSEYLAGGGSVVYMAEPTIIMETQPEGEEPMLAYFRENWGLAVRDDLVIDFTLSAQASPFWPASFAYGSGPITQDLSGSITIYPGVRSIEVSERLPEGVTVTPLVLTSPNAWGETDFETLDDGSMTPDDDEAVGELNLAIAAENSLSGARLVLFGDSDFATNQIVRDLVSNGDLFQNAAKWATVEEDLISLSPRPTTPRAHSITTVRDIAIVTLLACILPPVIVAAVGGSVWWSRRRMV